MVAELAMPSVDDDEADEVEDDEADDEASEECDVGDDDGEEAEFDKGTMKLSFSDTSLSDSAAASVRTRFDDLLAAAAVLLLLGGIGSAADRARQMQVDCWEPRRSACEQQR